MDIHIVNKGDESPLRTTAVGNRVDQISNLSIAGTNIDSCTISGYLTLQIAIRYDLNKLVAELVWFGASRN